MQKSRKILLITIFSFFSLSVFSVVLTSATLYSPASEITSSVVPTALAKDNSPHDPAKLSIPVLDIDAKVQQVGFTRKGNMATPNNFSDVGWFKYGTIPGQIGSAVIDGHVNNGLSFPGVFSNLEDIKKGDDVYLETEGGSTLHFVVTKLDTYDFNAPASEVFTEKDGKLLKLITCTGTWLDAFKTHSQRLVVTTKLVED